MTARSKLYSYAKDGTKVRPFHSEVYIKKNIIDDSTMQWQQRQQRIDTPLSILKQQRTILGANSFSQPAVTAAAPVKSRKAHFDNIALERIRYFEQDDCPRTVSTIGCHTDNNEVRQYIPKKDTQHWQRVSIIYTNWTPASIEMHHLAPMVLLDNIGYDQSATDQDTDQGDYNACEGVTKLQGTIRVRNQSYQKQVSVRYTLDNWRSFTCADAFYTRSISPLYDEFSFELDLVLSQSSDHQATISSQVDLAVQYCFNGRKFWDNNNGKNYQLFVTRHPTVPKKPTVVYPKTIKRPNSATSLFTSSALIESQAKLSKQSTPHDSTDTPSDSSNTISYPTYNKQTVLRTKHFMQEISLDSLCSSKPKHSGIRHISKPCNYATLMADASVTTTVAEPPELSQTLVKKYCYHGQLARHRPSLLL